ncbi:hypothetical protein SAY87_031900 [Trapa incisa]|uniref:Protein arginine N-methyltransferase domain-containing protein n=1 Tax=Trapa incisa TaxID=236973 RepID=A0AAN7KVW5_9MYRT|nr:hypothetical protein SAY87_031900 [Trapa incisa]
MALSLLSKCFASIPLHPNPRLRTAAAAMSSASAQRVLQLKVDPLTGSSEWVVIEEEDDGGAEASQDFQKSFLARTSYLDMLNDSYRNRCFREAIEKTVTQPCHVLDIGAGTGLLSMMAAQAMSQNESPVHSTKGIVTACESYLPMVKLMRKVLHINGTGRNISIINKRSDEVSVDIDIRSRADVLVSEILDSELLGEGLIPTLQHAHDILLVKNPQTVPYRATIYGQMVECNYLQKLHDLYSYENEASDGIHLVPAGMESILRVARQQYPMHCDAISKEIKLLSEPFKIFEFNFWRRPESSREIALRVKATADGQAHAIVSWWVLQLDRDGSIFYTTAPGWISSQNNSNARSWCDHWKQCVWFLHGEGLPLSKEEDASILAVHSETSISYQLEADCQYAEGDYHITLSPERIAIYGDCQWRCSILKAMRNAFQGRVPSLCVVADDSIFLAILVAHLSPQSRVMAFFPGLHENGSRYLQAVAGANGFTMEHVEVLGRRLMSLTMHETHQREVDLLIAEPFYIANNGMLPWHNLRFWKERTNLTSVLSKDALVIPCKGILKVCAMSLPDLWNSRHSLDKIEGFDHSIVNTTFGACGDAAEDSPCLPFSVWQCGEVKEISKTYTLMEFNFSMEMHSCFGKTEVKFSEDGTCHGLVLWIDWVMDKEASIVISTGPGTRYWKQGVKLLRRPVIVENNGSIIANRACSLAVEASFNSTNGELSIKHSS